MPEFYSKSFEFITGLTYAIGGGGTGYTSNLFVNGASYMDGVNALIVKGPGGATLNFVLAGSTLAVNGLKIDSGTIYPLRPRVLSVTGPNNIIGLL
jgi:hypothetical protein